jgi:hypothetical protein
MTGTGLREPREVRVGRAVHVDPSAAAVADRADPVDRPLEDLPGLQEPGRLTGPDRSARAIRGITPLIAHAERRARRG